MHKFYILFFLLLMQLILAAQDDDTSANEVVRFDAVKATAIVVREIPDSLIQNLKKDEAYWYADQSFRKEAVKKKEQAQKSDLINKSWFRTLMWILIIGGFIAVIIWYLVSSNLLLFRKTPSPISDADKIEIEEDIFSIEYEIEISKAIALNDYRLAIRLLYLQMLKKLSENGRIDYKIDNTNSEYIRQLANTPLYKGFFSLTRNFEYTWYGGFSLSPEMFQLLQQEFHQFKTTLN